MNRTLLIVCLCLGLAHSKSLTPMIPCAEFHAQLNIPCLCGLNEVNATVINCDESVFPEFPILPYRFYIQEFSQKNAGLQNLGNQLFTASDIPLKHLDFSHNQIRRLTERLFDGIEDSLEVLRLGNNLLGYNLNPVYSSSEFQNLGALRELDLSSNSLVDIDDGLFRGCKNLKDLKINGNKLKKVPTGALRGPKSLQNLFLQDNQITELSSGDFITQPKLLSLNLTNNLIRVIRPTTFANVTRLVRLILTRNKLSSIVSDEFKELTGLVELDLSSNFLSTVPMQALVPLKTLRFLNLGSNLIKSIKEANFEALSSLEYLDLSRNNIHEIIPGTFLGIGNLKGLDLSVNSLRKVEDDAFEGLTSLEYLDLSDNKISQLPSNALERLPNLKRFKAHHNTIDSISSEDFIPIQDLEELNLSYNMISQISPNTFASLSSLKILNLEYNFIKSLEGTAFQGLEDLLEYLNLAHNGIEILGPLNFSALKYINLGSNYLEDIEGRFKNLRDLNVLILRYNKITNLNAKTLEGIDNLIKLDISGNELSDLEPGVLINPLLNEINLSSNALSEINTGTFKELPILEMLDISSNKISMIKKGAFDSIPRLKTIDLSHNQLSSYKDDYFFNMYPNDTDLHTLDISHNELTYLYPESFRFHQLLERVDFSNNLFSFFPTQFMKDLPNLKTLNLRHNLLKNIDDSEFANFLSLKVLNLEHNEVESVSETAFQNSSQLQFLDLSHNRISNLEGDTFKGTIRLLLDLSHNNLSSMPNGIFDRPKVVKLQSLDLSHNKFLRIPVDVLQSQYFFLDILKVSNNLISEIPSDANILVNIKEIDLSFNPLSEDSVYNVLNEPKTVRSLNMAGTGVTVVPSLETPFLSSLNLSHNFISELNEDNLNKPSLEVIDISHNEIPDLSYGLSSAWPLLTNLKYLDISSNPVKFIIKGDFKYLDGLRSLKMSNLSLCNRIEGDAFKDLKELKELDLYSYKKIPFLDTKGVLDHFQALESINLEIKDELVGDQMHNILTPRLNSLGIRGKKIKNIATRALEGVSSEKFDLSLIDTGISNIPTALFLPVPSSIDFTLDVQNSELKSLSPTLLEELSYRDVKLKGLESNPIFCDCNTKALQNWLKTRNIRNVKCTGPDYLEDKLLVDLPEYELSCEGRTTTTTTEVEYVSQKFTSTPEPDIITGDDLLLRKPISSSTRRPTAARKPQHKTAGTNPYNMDALIIGIVGGVVAFITIIIVIICIVRLRLTDSQYRGGPLGGPLALRSQGKCTCLKPVVGYGSSNGGYLSYPSTPVPPPHQLALTWGGGTINSQKMLPPSNQGPPSSLQNGNNSNNFGTIGPHSYLSAGTVVSRGSHHHHPSYPGTFQPLYPNTPYYVTFPADSDGETSPPHGRESGNR
ncbi:unnamed protein product [Lepeophtheirus salmonis]|uniref:(salmon louse) hypothetical protein n=1 Tax=Lepeophtheirus salmonis TaxID=72036 RepID=A0A7R8CD73_LEPSM|nr:unnamed protein product [Lepeophtheirus salmonis]CAF2773724.1 unnamed protein product [Lepeophtheirus salmonis]